MRQQLLNRDSRGATRAGNPPSVRIHPRGAPGNGPGDATRFVGHQEFLFAGTHYDQREAVNT